jgi:hypothetical protein
MMKERISPVHVIQPSGFGSLTIAPDLEWLTRGIGMSMSEYVTPVQPRNREEIFVRFRRSVDVGVHSCAETLLYAV